MADDGRDEIEALIARVALGDRAAFARLYDAVSGKLLAVCLRVLDDRAAAEDALQETFIKVWNSAGRYRVTGHSPMSWLITVARNTALDRLRARRPGDDVADFADRIAASAPTPEQSAVAASETRRVIACLDELGPDRRAAVVEVYLRGRAYRELADQLDVPLNTVRTWLRRSLMALRECLSR